MKKLISLCLSILFVFLSVIPCSAVARGTDSVGEINAFHKLVSVSPQMLSLDRGQAFKLSVSLDSTISGYSVSWTSSDSSVASVTSYGLVVAKSAGTAVITVSSDAPMVQGYTYFDTCNVTVSSNKVVEDGTYFIQTAQKNSNSEYLDAFVEIENHSTANGAKMEVGTLSGQDYKKWVMTLENDGYYTIESVYSSKFMRVTGNSASAGSTITQNSTVSLGSKWSLLLTASGNYAFVPASSTSSLVVLNLPGSASGCDLNTAFYSNNSDYKDEWLLNRMLPTNGSELAYSPNDWGAWSNCYQYALNCDAKPWSPSEPWVLAQPGDYSHTSITGFGTNPELIVDAVTADFEQYNYEFNTAKYFAPIGKYDVCPSGSYKVALVIGQGVNEYNEIVHDYHWYRQDSDGLWSHKRGTTQVTRMDANYRYIIDPETAARNYTQYDYSTFVGFFALSPWNHRCNSSSNSLDYSELSEREKAICFLSSLGATSLTGRAVFSLTIDESRTLVFDCESMSGYIDVDGFSIPVDADFITDGLCSCQ